MGPETGSDIIHPQTYRMTDRCKNIILPQTWGFQKVDEICNNVTWTFCFDVVKPLIPILALLPMWCVCENLETLDMNK